MARTDDPKPYTPSEIDTTEDRMGSVHELNFHEDVDGPRGRIGDERSEAEVDHEFPEARVAQAGMSGGEALTEGVHEDGVTDDDMSPETLLDETGARDPFEPGDGGGPADLELREVDADEVGLGTGLDEAEEAHVHPLDGKPWSDDEIPDDRNDA